MLQDSNYLNISIFIFNILSKWIIQNSFKGGYFYQMYLILNNPICAAICTIIKVTPVDDLLEIRSIFQVELWQFSQRELWVGGLGGGEERAVLSE